MRRSSITDQFFMFATDIHEGWRSATVATVFFAHSSVTPQRLTDQLMEFLDNNAECEEIWLMFPNDLNARAVELANSDIVVRRLSESTQQFVRAFSFDIAGGLTEQRGMPTLIEGTSHVSPKAATEQILPDGMRQAFRDTNSLLISHSGYHFGKPGGSHSHYFLRSANAVSRSLHGLFAAVLNFGSIDVQRAQRVWVDTAGVLPVAHALGHWRARLGSGELLVADTFGGYEGIEKNLTGVEKTDVVLISGSTSGSLAKRLVEVGVPLEAISTLFYLGESREPASGNIVCDLTARDTLPPSVNAGILEPYKSWPANECDECAGGLPLVELSGDSFLPATGTLTKRRLTLRHGTEELSRLMQDFFGLEVVRVHASDESAEGAVRSLVLRIGHVLDDTSANADVRQSVRQALADMPTHSQIDAIVYTTDSDSERLARFASSVVQEHGAPAPTVLNDKANLRVEFSARVPNHVLIVNAVSSSGRAILNINRMLRFLNSDRTLTSYLIGVASPESLESWTVLESNLTQRGPTAKNALKAVWRVLRDPTRGDFDPWTVEERLLRKLLELKGAAASKIERELVNARLQQITNLSKSQRDLFVPAQFDGTDGIHMPVLNPHFVFWRFEWRSHPRHRESAVEPSQGEVFTTISSALHTYRYSGDGKYSFYSAGGHRFVLDPVMFDRFNDPVIQASILRAARYSELDYSSDELLSSTVVDLILYMRDHVDSDAGAALSEFLISISHSLLDASGPGLRLSPAELSRLVGELDRCRDSLPLFVRLLHDFVSAYVPRRSAARQ